MLEDLFLARCILGK